MTEAYAWQIVAYVAGSAGGGTRPGSPRRSRARLRRRHWG
jgi:hypothetical protein